MKHYKDRLAVVAGGASGSGRAMAETFVKAGMTVALADVDEQMLKNAVGALEMRISSCQFGSF